MLPLLLSAADAFARAGGGHSSGGHSSGSSHSFSSGSYSSGSSSHGSGGDGGVFGSLFGLIFVAVVAYIIYRAVRGVQAAFQNGVIARGSQAAESTLVIAGPRQLQENDAAFDAITFCARTRDGFTKLQRAKCEYCHAVLRSGHYDWVLAEIMQEEKWHPCDTPPPGTQAKAELRTAKQEKALGKSKP